MTTVRKVRRIKEGSAAHEALEQQETIDITTLGDANRRVLSVADNVEYIIEKQNFTDSEKAFRSGPRNISDLN